MSKAVSYYDWSLGFKGSEREYSSKNSEKQLNSIGITDDELNEYLKKWKEANLA